jgi:hypothetical protein
MDDMVSRRVAVAGTAALVEQRPLVTVDRTLELGLVASEVINNLSATRTGIAQHYQSLSRNRQRGQYGSTGKLLPTQRAASATASL